MRVKASRLGESWVDIRVIDTGPGIPPAEAVKIFDKFHQVMTQDTLSDKPKGTGLGLSISRQIVEHYGGSIWVESLVGEGSTFAFKIPALKGTAQPVYASPAGGSADKRRILVVEDDLAFQKYLGEVLTEVGFEVAVAGNGAEAIEKALALKPDLITMDHRMPHMDGGAAVKTLRSSAELRDIPVIYITGHADDAAPEADTVLEKPVLDSALLQSVRLLLGERPSHREKTAILVVEVDGVATAVPEHLADLGKVERCRREDLAGA